MGEIMDRVIGKFNKYTISNSGDTGVPIDISEAANIIMTLVSQSTIDDYINEQNGSFTIFNEKYYASELLEAVNPQVFRDCRLRYKTDIIEKELARMIPGDEWYVEDAEAWVNCIYEKE
jgi:hypothetical protein